MKLIFLFVIIGAVVMGLVSADVGDPGCRQEGQNCGSYWGWCCGDRLRCRGLATGPGQGINSIKLNEHEGDLNESDETLLREAATLSAWIKEKENQIAQIADGGEDLEEVEVLQKKFDDFNDDLKANEVCLTNMNEIAVQLTTLGQTEATLKIQTQMQDLNEKWASNR